MTVKTLPRNIWQRIVGIPATKPPKDAACWSVSDGRIVVDLTRAPELSQPFGALRIEGKTTSERVLVFRDGANNLRAVCNRCGHAGRRLDPVPDTETVQCCSMGHSTYGYDGKLVVESATVKPIQPYRVRTEGTKLIIDL